MPARFRTIAPRSRVKGSRLKDMEPTIWSGHRRKAPNVQVFFLKVRFLIPSCGLMLLASTLAAEGEFDAPEFDAPEFDQPSPVAQEQTVKNASGGCLEPPPTLLRWQDYHGPYEKLVGTFARKLERKSARQARYKPGTLLCSLEAREKFMLFVHDTVDPISFLSAGFNAGMDQASDRDRAFGQGAEGFGKRYAADLASQTDWRFFTDFAYPVLFSEDPRYYPLSQGSAGARLLHAAEHALVAHRDDGTHMFNFSLWLGTGTAIAISDFIHPGNERRFGAGLRAAGYSVGIGIGMDVLREFAPEISRKLHLPFRDNRGEAASPGDISGKKQ